MMLPDDGQAGGGRFGVGGGQSGELRVAIVHEWLETFAGSERVFAELVACFPKADLFTLVDVMPEATRGFLGGRPVRTSFIQRLPFARRRFRLYLPLMPLAIEQFDLAGYDLILSSSHAVAKGVITGPDQLHISYVHSPMRYAWDMQAQYLRQSGLDRGLRGMQARWLLHRLRQWDVRTANGVDVFVANSTYVARRIRKVYRRDAVVVHPPVDIERFTVGAMRGDSYLVVSRLVPYKRVDLVVAAFARMPDRQLIVVGDGPENQRVRAAAHGAPNISFRGVVPQAELISLMQAARAFVFAGEEDFGIALVEAQACGTPLIAFARGGVRDILAGGATGVLFDDQEPEAIIAAVARFERRSGDMTATACRRNAERFSRAAFCARLLAVIADARAAQSPGLRHLQSNALG